MMKKCKFCKRKFDGSQRKVYCSAKCKKNFENSLRSTPIAKVKKSAKRVFSVPTNIPIDRPRGLNLVAATYWDKIAPTLIQRGHLNILSEDAFAELCDIHSRLVGINHAIDETNQSLLQIDDKWDNRAGTETQSMKESALSDLKRKYSARFLDYCKQFYLTPLSNRGSFNLDDEKEKEQDEFFTD